MCVTLTHSNGASNLPHGQEVGGGEDARKVRCSSQDRRWTRGSAAQSASTTGDAGSLTVGIIENGRQWDQRDKKTNKAKNKKPEIKQGRLT